jgi:hypothetical protein
LRGPNHEGVLLIPQGCIRLARDQKQTWLVLHILNDPFTGHPVNVHIEYIQENADPDTTILDESGLELFLNGDDFPVTGRYDKTSTLRDHPGWITKEPRDEERQERRPDRHNHPAQPYCQQCNADSGPNEGNSFFGKRDADGTIRHFLAISPQQSA